MGRTFYVYFEQERYRAEAGYDYYRIGNELPAAASPLSGRTR